MPDPSPDRPAPLAALDRARIAADEAGRDLLAKAAAAYRAADGLRDVATFEFEMPQAKPVPNT